MSWISGLADKAENILNTIDQNAASALQVPDTLTTITSASTCDIDLTDSVESPDKLERGVYEDNAMSRKASISSDCVAIDLELLDNDNTKSENAVHPSSLTITEAGEVGQELAAFKIALSEVSSERDELRCKLASLNRNVENTGLKQRVRELELLVQRLAEEREQAQQKLNDAQEVSNANYHSISELEANLSKHQQMYLETAQKLQMQIKESEQNRQDLEDYRLKAQRALQSKDHLIKELKSTTVTSDVSDTRIANLEFDTLKQEQKQLQEENRKLALQLEETRHDMNELNKLNTEQLVALRSNEVMLRAERERAFSIESKHRTLTQELDICRNQLTQVDKKLQESNAQLQQLRTLKVRQKVDTTDALVEEYDTRLRTLTQALVIKQSDVEKITAERNALRIQLENVQDQSRKSNYNNRSNQNSAGNAILLNSTDDIKAQQLPLLLKENPFDNRMARRFKRAYSSLDSAGIRLGAFLRRYPLMRISVLMYVGLLHIWVVLVLFLSTPN